MAISFIEPDGSPGHALPPVSAANMKKGPERDALRALQSSLRSERNVVVQIVAATRLDAAGLGASEDGRAAA